MAIPTAIPEAPLIRRLGSLQGKTVGSFKVPSKLGINSTVSKSKSFSNSIAAQDIRTSVYLIAAGVSPSIEPKLPCPSIRGCL